MQITSNPGSVSSLTRSTINPFRSVRTQIEVWHFLFVSANICCRDAKFCISTYLELEPCPWSVSSLTLFGNLFRSVETQTEVMETQNLASPPDYKKFLKE